MLKKYYMRAACLMLFGMSGLARGGCSIAQDDQLTIDRTTLKTSLFASDYEKLSNALRGMGHVGEGHCTVTDTELKE